MPQQPPLQPHLPEIAPQADLFVRVPQAVLDQLLAELGLAELRVWLYIVRRSVGFGERSARISLDQFARGACDAEGRSLDVGTGLSRRAIRLALRSLEARGPIRRSRRSSPQAGDLATEYTPRAPAASHPPVGTAVSPLGARDAPPPGSPDIPPVGIADHHDRKTVLRSSIQEIDQVDRSRRISNLNGDLSELRAFLGRIAGDLHDTAPAASTATRGVNLMQDLDIGDVALFEELCRQAWVTTKARGKGVAYFFAVLNGLGQAHAQNTGPKEWRSLAGRYAQHVRR